MQINIHYNGELKRRLDQVIREKLERLEHFYSRIIQILALIYFFGPFFYFFGISRLIVLQVHAL